MQVGEYQGAYKVSALSRFYNTRCYIPNMHGNLQHGSTPAAACWSQVFYPLQITRGLLQKYGAERVRDTPITEVPLILSFS